jgi:hypothetical protein
MGGRRRVETLASPPGSQKWRKMDRHPQNCKALAAGNIGQVFQSRPVEGQVFGRQNFFCRITRDPTQRVSV